MRLSEDKTGKIKLGAGRRKEKVKKMGDVK